MNVNHQVKVQTKIKIKSHVFAYMTLTLFIFNETVRGMLSESFGWINLLFLIGCFGLVGYSILKDRIRPILFFVASAFSAFALLSAVSLHKPPVYFGMMVANLLAPLYLLSVKIEKPQAVAAFRVFVKLFNLLIVLLLAFGVIDYLTKGSIQTVLALTVFSNSGFGELITTERAWGIYRYYSFIGHPLTNAKYFLVFFISNSIYGRYYGYLMNKYVVSIITIAGLVLSGSKTALMLGFVLVLFFNGIRKGKVVYYLGISTVAAILLNTSLFNENLKIRFLQGIESGDLSSGRNPLLTSLLDSQYRPSVFLGGGADYSREVAMWINGNGVLNFEYPPIMLAFDYGLLGVLLIYFCIFLYPAIRFVRKKQMYILFAFGILTVMLNTSNGIAQLGLDAFSQMCFLIMILINLPSTRET